MNDNYSEIVLTFAVIDVWNLNDEISNGGSLPGKSVNGTDNPLNGTISLLFDSWLKNFINSFIMMVCLWGLVGNGTVIWILGFHVKRNPFTTYILNLSIADMGVLISLILTSTFVIIVIAFQQINTLPVVFKALLELFFFTYSASQFLLAAISIDRCVAVLFPLWHRCRRPSNLSHIACALIWSLSFLLSATHFALHWTRSVDNSPVVYQLIGNILFCTPLMLASTLILIVYTCCKPGHHSRQKLVTAILLALLFFLVLAVPLNVFYIVKYYYGFHPILMVTGLGCAALNSSINPLIYFLVGWGQKKGQPKVDLRAEIQRFFKDEPDSKEEQNTMSETFAEHHQ
ncbi:hypothetical protein JRQ81_010816 [Phrynocephalus forsythii]|uniref:G-protein coupled receptors family 1 profile domain-containing protein n=1 Tax=Phrynocephalus forsythii TaxID=171643 RepID=A0A9Q0Y1G2_9SAUR|nr:hypothetical protein JRQ81_010816 [Phrynocephalus forsythii]